ncbi:response regulator transcription factor [Myxococcota bacterium]|nr:response regulator transcription factor [Myxococcota bacterium]
MLRAVIFDDELYRRPGFADTPGAIVRIEVSADKAVQVVREFEPDVVFMDYSLFGSSLSGAQAVTALRKEFGPEELHILGVSSSTQGNNLIVQAGANGSTSKNSIPSVIEKMVAQRGA